MASNKKDMKFELFPRLAVELRLMVWNICLFDEASTRLIIFHYSTMQDGYRAMPFKHLASPFLQVNCESRGEALAFYNVKLDIYALTPLPDPRIERRSGPQWGPRDQRWLGPGYGGSSDETGAEEQESLDDGSSDEMDAGEQESLDNGSSDEMEQDSLDGYESSWSDSESQYDNDWRPSRALRSYADSRIREIKSEPLFGRKSGVMYISLEHDIFVRTRGYYGAYDSTHYFCVDKTTEMDQSKTNPWDIPFRHISAGLSPPVSAGIQKLVCVESADDEERDWEVDLKDHYADKRDMLPISYSMEEAEDIWDAATFQGIVDYGHLYLTQSVRYRFISQIAASRGMGSYADAIRWWVKHEEPGDGWWVQSTEAGEDKPLILIDEEMFLELKALGELHF